MHQVYLIYQVYLTPGASGDLSSQILGDTYYPNEYQLGGMGAHSGDLVWGTA